MVKNQPAAVNNQPEPNTTLSAVHETYDHDGDTVELEYSWTVNGASAGNAFGPARGAVAKCLREGWIVSPASVAHWPQW